MTTVTHDDEAQPGAPPPLGAPPPQAAPPPPRYASPPSQRELMMFRIMFMVGGLFLRVAILVGVLAGSRPG